MDDTLQLQNSTLNLSETGFSFPPHRRRPLRSRTYHALIGILSHCRTDLPQLQTQVLAFCEVDIGDSELRQVSEENGSTNCSEVRSVDALVPHPNSEISEAALVQETTVSENKGNFSVQEGGFDGKHTTEQNFDQINLVKDSEQEGASESRISRDFRVVESQTGDCAIQISKEQENVNSFIDIQMDEFGTGEELEVDNEFSIHDFSEVFDSCFVMDMIVEPSKGGEDGQENGTFLEESKAKEAEHELQLKEIELEKLIHDSGAVESSCCPNADDEIEEGEISGDAGVADASFDALSEDAVSQGERNGKALLAYEDSFDKEELIYNDEDRGRRHYETSDPSLVNVLNTDTDSMKVDSRTTFGQMQHCRSQNVFHDSHTETQRSGPIAACLGNLTSPGRIVEEIAVENQNSATTEKDHDASQKKRKKGPLTKERRAKKKKKERLKRAENNRKLGVKRLKIQPVFKEKKISYCRHYLQGRCHEGEKCNFSHDTVPLTKSKPCGHFARHSCLKGDDCLFDHQLSKYPCKNYTSTGFCGRGSDCLFSHEMPAKQSFSVTPNGPVPELTSAQHTVPDKGGSYVISKVTKPEVKFPSPLNNLNTIKHTDNRGIFQQKIDGKLCSAGNSHGKSAGLLPANPAPRTARQAPRGVSFLLNGGMPSGDSSKNKQDEPSIKTTDGVDVGCKTILKAPNKLNRTSERAGPRKPRGINFLFFAQPSSDDSSRKILSNLLSNSNNETGKSVMDDMGEGKLARSLPESSGIHKVNSQINQIASNMALWSSDKTGGGNLHLNKGDTALSFVKERQSTSIQLLDTIQLPSLSFGASRNPSTGAQNERFSSSFKTSLLSNAPSLVQKAIQSTLAFAEKFEPDIKVRSFLHQRGS